MTATFAVASPAEASSGHLHLSSRAAVPGQVITMSGPGITAEPEVTIGGKEATVVSTKRRKLRVEVPDLEPGKAAIIVRSGARRLTGRLKIKPGFPSEVTPQLETPLAASAEVGPAGGVVTARGSDGTTYELTIPAGALVAPEAITLTPVASLGGLPRAEDAHVVQFAPDGLGFAVPAGLRITPPKPLRSAVGLAYVGSGDDLTLAPASRSGGSLFVEIRHFSGAGASAITEPDFERLVAQLATFPLNLEVAGRFFRDFRAVPASWCDSSHATCHALKIEISNFLGGLTTDDCLGGVGSFIDLMLNELNVLISLEADAQAVGFTFPSATNCRQTLTLAMFDLTRGPARDDALGASNPCSGVRLAQADYDGDGTNANVECLLLVAAQAQVQSFSAIVTAAMAAITAGLRKVLDVGKTKCDGTNFLDGKPLLEKGLKIATVSVLEAEFRSALADCKEKIKVDPPEITLAPGEHFTFTAKVNYLDPDIRWRASGGTIPDSGNTAQYTAPSELGTYIVTATDLLIPGISGTATVKVAPTVAVSIDPTSVNLRPGGTQQFTATVTGASDTSVTWSATGGTISQSGLYTVGSNTGSFTVTARSVANPTKSASATVLVASVTLVRASIDACASVDQTSDCTFAAGAYNVSASGCGSSSLSGTTGLSIQNGDLHMSDVGSSSVSGTIGCDASARTRVQADIQVAGGSVELACQSDLHGNTGIIAQFVSVNGGTIGQRLLCTGLSSNAITLPPDSYHVTIWYEIQSPRDNAPGTSSRTESFSADVVTR